MPNNNYNYGASYIMNSDKTSVDDQMGANKLTRESKDFDIAINDRSGSMIEAHPKKQTKPTVQSSLFAMADQKDY